MKKQIEKLLYRLHLVKPQSIYEKIHYSQEGEDVILERIIGGEIHNGFYVDIGAHHPIKFSNTYLFYKRGWQGINIDAMPGSMKEFNILRPRDINLEIPISDSNELLTYYMFNYPELNTFVKKNADEWNGKGMAKLISKEKLKTSSITEVLNKYYTAPSTSIDILSIDVEGMDYKILKSIDLNKYSVKYIIIEEGDIDINRIINGDIYKYLLSNNYQFTSKLHNSCIYKKVEI